MGSIQGKPACLWFETLLYNRAASAFIPSNETLSLVPTAPRNMTLRFRWDPKSIAEESNDLTVMNVVAKPLNSDMTGRRAPLGINGGRVGEEHRFTVKIPPRGSNHEESFNYEMSVVAPEKESFSFYDVVFYRIDEIQDTTSETNRKEVTRTYTREFPFASIGFRTTQRGSDGDSDGDGVSDYEEVLSGLDPYSPLLDLDDVARFFAREVRRVLTGVNLLQGRATNVIREGSEVEGGGRRELHITEEANVYSAFIVESTNLPAAADALNTAMKEIARRNFYPTLGLIRVAISELGEVRVKMPVCRVPPEVSKRTENTKKTKKNGARNLREPGSLFLPSHHRPAAKGFTAPPEVAGHIRDLEALVEKVARYLSSGSQRGD